MLLYVRSIYLSLLTTKLEGRIEWVTEQSLEWWQHRYRKLVYHQIKLCLES